MTEKIISQGESTRLRTERSVVRGKGLMSHQAKKLLGTCLKGEKHAWDSFVLQYSGLVYHSIKKTLSLYDVAPRPDIVEDLFQDFFLSLVRDKFLKLRQFRGDRGTNLATWLRVIACRQTIDYLRKREFTTTTNTDIFSPNHPDPPTSLIEQEQKQLVSQSLQTLPPRDRLFIQLHFDQSLSPDEIASIFQVSINAFYTQKSRILGKLREALRNSGIL